ncbi:MAG: hypothetical protein HOK06_08385 [Rhodospirillaceae bacterium]|nr:hypothetical protein [Rhodospirillaceae bacterium]MBT4220654.1 hypothetical protein [Rhodospirillaceae bacterium]MBT4463865.1 hypothetical protein [Rhodospirillaceae bacterium]MBT5014609.1 hypothetical protein [Rhodospirillaceae bacterium]MBT5308630.1 hypothetical protein [Rhodospirillaceae bacterium]
MTDAQHVKDENLRLVLSADQEQWLQKRIRESQTFIKAAAIILVFSAAWLTTNMPDTFSLYQETECFSFSDNSPANQELREQFLAEGLKPCSEIDTTEANSGKLDIWRVLSALSAILILVSSLTLIRHLYLLQKNKTYLVDHQAFLAKYNRL